MKLETWKEAAHKNLQQLAQSVNEIAPRWLYGALSAAALLPLVTAPFPDAKAALIALVGATGGNLLANQIQTWSDQQEEALAQQLPQQLPQQVTNQAAQDDKLREALDQLLQKLAAPQTVMTQLSPEDKAYFEREFARSASRIGSQLTVLGDLSVQGNLIQSRDVSNSEMTAIGTQIQQIKETHHHYTPAPEVKPDPRQRYLKRLRQSCSSLPLAMLGGDDESGGKLTLDQIYIDLNTTTSEPLSLAEKEARKKQNRTVGEDEQKPVSALEIATRHRRLVLLGDPGSGKSTFVQKLTGLLAAVGLGEPVDLPAGWQSNLLPVFTLLRELAPHLASLNLNGLNLNSLSESERDKRLLNALRDYWQSELLDNQCADFVQAFETALREGAVCLVFDGLDEVPQQSRSLVRLLLRALLQEYQQVERVIITCRVRSYTGSAVLTGWPNHRLAVFNRQQIAQFVEAWYNTQFALGQIRSEQERRSQIEDLQRAVQGDALRELAENPMLLTTMALIHQREVRLPNQRVKLYHLAVENLLQRWQRRKFKLSERLEKVLNDERLLGKIVERIGYESLRVRNLAEQQQAKLAARQRKSTGVAKTSDDDQSGDLRRGELLVLLEEYLPENGLPDEFVDYIDQRAGLLVGRGGDEIKETLPKETQSIERKPLSYRFPHRTFQEYLAGCYLASKPDVADAYWQHAAADGWELAALLGGEELYFVRKNDRELLETLCHLCPEPSPRTPEEWRRVLWSAQLAMLFQRSEIERYARGKETGTAYLKRLQQRLLSAIEIKSKLAAAERAIAGVALGKLGDTRKGVSVVRQVDYTLPDIDWIEIPAGPFIMGGKESWLSSE